MAAWAHIRMPITTVGTYEPYYDSYSYPAVGGYYSGVPAASYYYDDSTNVAPLPLTASAPAQIEVIVPDPTATLWFDGRQTSQSGTTRYFDSPDLQPGKTFYYTVRASWTQGGQPQTAEQVIEVRAGSQLVVDFRQTPVKVNLVR
jgi:uncharacterized protein (TIGR03000 family)